MATHPNMNTTGENPLLDLIGVMQRLRDPVSGCPWDVEQDFHTIAPYTLEEAYEVVEAIENNDSTNLEKELGDLLLQVIFLSQIGQEKGLFDINSVTSIIVNKLIDRHPHVFGDCRDIKSAQDQTEFWENAKAEERQVDRKSGPLDGICLNLPAVSRAQKIQDRAARAGYEFPNHCNLIAKFDEEIAEIREAVRKQDTEKINEEIGDLLFTVVNFARFNSCDAEQALRMSTSKFVERINAIERLLDKQGQTFANLPHDERETLWEAVKHTLKATD